jgi:hypothetical protein
MRSYHAVLIWSGVPLWKRKDSSFPCMKVRQNHLEERRKYFVGFVFLGVQCSVWLVDMVEGVEVSGYRRCQFLS